jgi:hypothetical protein
MGGWADGPMKEDGTDGTSPTHRSSRIAQTQADIQRLEEMWVAETWRLLLKDLMVPRIQTYLSCLRCVSEEGGGQTKWRRSQKELR